MHDAARFRARSTSHTVAVPDGCTNIPLAAGRAQEDENHSRKRRFRPRPASDHRPGSVRTNPVLGITGLARSLSSCGLHHDAFDEPSGNLFGGRLYNVDRLHFEWGSIIGRGNLSGRPKHRRRRDRGVSRFATGESESLGCLIEHPRLTSGSTAGGGADGPVHGSPSARSARFVRGDKTCSPASDRGVRPSRAADDASREGKAEAQRYSDFASKDEDHDGGGR